MANKKQLFMESTEITAGRSVGEITALLVEAGASQIATDYGDGKITGLRFVLNVNGLPLAFSLPARTEPVFKTMLKYRPYSSYHRKSRMEYEQDLRENAERVGWRQLYRWVQAQLSLMDLGMVTAHEVFFPYMMNPFEQGAARRTMFQVFDQEAMPKMLEAPKSN